MQQAHTCTTGKLVGFAGRCVLFLLKNQLAGSLACLWLGCLSCLQPLRMEAALGSGGVEQGRSWQLAQAMPGPVGAAVLAAVRAGKELRSFQIIFCHLFAQNPFSWWVRNGEGG